MKLLYLYLVFALFLALLFSSCQKEISFATDADTNDSLQLPPPPPPHPDPTILALNTWQFLDSNNGSYHHVIIDTVNTLFDIKPIWNYLRIVGWPENSFGSINNDTMLLTALYLPNTFIEPGVYNISSGTGGDHIFGFGNKTLVPPYGSNQNFCYYLATPDIAPNFTIRIVSYDTQKKILKGDFNGHLLWRSSINDYSLTHHSISGSFYLRLN